MEALGLILSLLFVGGVFVALVMYFYDLLTNEYVDSPYEDELHL